MKYKPRNDRLPFVNYQVIRKKIKLKFKLKNLLFLHRVSDYKRLIVQAVSIHIFFGSVGALLPSGSSKYRGYYLRMNYERNPPQSSNVVELKLVEVWKRLHEAFTEQVEQFEGAVVEPVAVTDRDAFNSCGDLFRTSLQPIRSFWRRQD